MEALLASFLESLMPAAVGGSEAVMSGGAAPLSFGQQATQAVGNMISPQMQPYQNFYNTATNPNASMADTARSGFQLAFNPKDDEKALMMPQMGGGYGGGMSNNYVGGIPSILQNTGSGILPYIGSR
jgi:hypothetical protein